MRAVGTQYRFREELKFYDVPKGTFKDLIEFKPFHLQSLKGQYDKGNN